MARLATTGFGGGFIPSAVTMDGFLFSTVSGAIEASVTPRGVGYSYAIPYTGSSIELHYNTVIGASQADTFHRAEFGFDTPSAAPPPANCSIFGLYDGTNVGFVHWRTDGRLQFTDLGGTVTVSPSGTTLSASAWYRMEVRLRNGTTTSNGQWEVNVYDVPTNTLQLTFSSSAANLGTTTYRPYWGNSNSNTASGVTLYLANVAVNDTSGSDQNSWCGVGQIVTLRPAGDSAVGSGWQKPGGSTSNLNTALDGVPPAPPSGDSTSSGDAETMVRNATNTTTSNLDETLDSYTAAGIGASDTISLLRPFAWAKRAGATAQSPALVGVSNPAVTSATTAVTGTTGTFPTNWTQMLLPFQYAPSVTLGTGPVLRIGKRTATTQALLCCSMGILVEYIPASGTTTTLPAGGATGGGVAPTPVVAVTMPQGPGNAGGSTPAVNAAVTMPTGGAAGGGQAPNPAQAQAVPQGGSQGGGAAPSVNAQVILTTGGGTGGGQAPNPSQAQSVPAGGASAGGATPSVSARASMPQGAAAGGGASPTVNATVTLPAGGALGGGYEVAELGVLPQGGSVGGGYAPSIVQVVALPAGGAQAGGAAPTVNASTGLPQGASAGGGAAPTVNAAVSVAVGAAAGGGRAPSVNATVTLPQGAAEGGGRAPTQNGVSNSPTILLPTAASFNVDYTRAASLTERTSTATLADRAQAVSVTYTAAATLTARVSDAGLTDVEAGAALEPVTAIVDLTYG